MPLHADTFSVAQWDDCLRLLMPVTYDPRWDDPAVRWLDSAAVLDRTTTTETWRRLSEALDVLSLIARTHLPVWRLERHRLWPTQAVAWGKEPEMFAIGLVVHVQHDDMLAALGARVLDAERLHRYYCLARERLVNVDQWEICRTWVLPTTRPRIPIRLQFEEGFGNADTLALALIQTLQITATQRILHTTPTVDGRGGTWATDRARFEIERVDFHAMVEMDEKGLRYLVKLVEFGVIVHSIPNLYMEIDLSRPRLDGHEALSLVEGLQRLVAGIGCDSSKNFRGVERLTISDTTHSEYYVPILSAAQASQSLRTVYVRILQEETQVPGQIDQHLVNLWRGLAYFLFSPHAEHNITRLELELDHFRAEYVDAVRSVLWAWRPVLPETLGAGVFDRLLGHPSQRLTCSKVYLFDPTSDDQAAVCVNQVDPIDLRVIDPGNASDGIRTVLLPGWGKGWVRDQAETSTRVHQPLPVQPVVGDCRSFLEISISAINQASIPAATTLLGLIGRHVNHLEIAGAENDVGLDVWLADVLPHLPSLHHLTILTGRLSRLDTLTDSLIAANCKIQSLVIDRDVPDADQIQRFFDALRDPRHGIGMHLGELQLKLHAGLVPALRILCDALQQNCHLHTVRLHFSPPPTQGVRDSILRILSPTMKAKTTCLVAPLGIVEKTAFMSVVSNDASRSTPIEHLDTTMISTIFEFAGQGKTRDIQITFAE